MVVKTVRLLVLLIIPIILSCGIKKSPKPPLKPKFDVKRIGAYVYVIPKEDNITVKGFKKHGNYYLKMVSGKDCFKVKSPGKSDARVCVEEALTLTPEVEIKRRGEHVELALRGFRRWNLYELKEDNLILESEREVRRKTLRLERDYVKRCYAITGVMGKRESPPYNFCVSPKPIPRPEPPKNLELVVSQDKLILVWSLKESLEYVVYKNGREVYRTRGNSFVGELPEGTTTYEVIAINPLGGRSEPAKVVYRP